LNKQILQNTALKQPLFPVKAKAAAGLLRPPAKTLLRVLVYRAILLGAGALRDGAAHTCAGRRACFISDDASHD